VFSRLSAGNPRAERIAGSMDARRIAKVAKGLRRNARLRWGNPFTALVACAASWAWDTGERTGALLALRWEMLDCDGGQLVVPAAFRKGRRKPMLYLLKPPTLRALEKIRLPERDLIFGWPSGIDRFYARYKRLLKLARLPYVKNESSLQKMRRSFATHIEAAGGDATEALAHTARSLTIDSYIDPQMIEPTPANELLFPLETATA
jgi:integrase